MCSAMLLLFSGVLLGGPPHTVHRLVPVLASEWPLPPARDVTAFPKSLTTIGMKNDSNYKTNSYGGNSLSRRLLPPWTEPSARPTVPWMGQRKTTVCGF